MKDTKHGKWTVSTSEYAGVVSAECYGKRWEFRDGELVAEVQASEECGHFDSGSPSDRYLPAAVLLDMMRRAGLIPPETSGEAADGVPVPRPHTPYHARTTTPDAGSNEP